MEPERPRGGRDVAVSFADGVHDQVSLEFVDGGVELREAGGVALAGSLRRLEDRFGQVGRNDQLALAQGYRALDGVLELADVARPGVALQTGAGARAETARGPPDLAAEAGGEVAGEERDVLPPVAQRRQG